MFYKILAVLMLIATTAGAQTVTPCNAFGQQGIACDEPAVVENFELIAEDGDVLERIELERTGVERATQQKAKRVSRTIFPSLNQPCGPLFSRNESCAGEKCNDCNEPEPEPEPVVVKKTCVKNYAPVAKLDYEYIHRQCSDFAPINFAYVDFKIDNKSRYSGHANKLGDYRFRIFGCRRNDKEMFLDVGRTMQKDMNFFGVFNKVYGDCIPQQRMPVDICNPYSNEPMPEYLLTAEIVDYAMNVCDEFDWRSASNKEKRKGSSEMTVVWRLMDVAREKVFWQGTSTGYADLDGGAENGEIILVEDAFEDALSKLRYLEGFEKQISTRHSAEEKMAQRIALANLERRMNPAKCDYQEEILGTTMRDGCPRCPVCPECNVYAPAKPVMATQEEVLVIDDCQQRGGCAPVFKRNEDCDSISCKMKKEEPLPVVVNDSCEQRGDCGPIFKRNEGCDSLSCKMKREKGLPIEEGDGCSEKGDCGPIFKRNEGCDSLICRMKDDEIDVATGEDVFGNVDTVRVVENEWVDIPVTQEQQQIVEAMFVESKGEFCIENELVNKEMNPFNVYKTRASIVQISSISGKKKGVGLIINDQFILTSADMISKDENLFNVKTINGVEFKANGFRFSPKKNVALLLTHEPVKYTPLPLNLELPPVGAKGFFTMGMDLHENGGEGYVDDTTSIAGYRFSEDRGAEIITNQRTQNLTVGGALVDDKGNIYGIAHYGRRYNDEADMYMPIEEALKSLNVELCGRDFLNQNPWVKSNVETKRFKAPEEMIEIERK